MEAKQTETERLIYDSKEYLKRNHFGEYTLLYILNKEDVYKRQEWEPSGSTQLGWVCHIKSWFPLFTIGEQEQIADHTRMVEGCK